jgi:hypothetical protein
MSNDVNVVHVDNDHDVIYKSKWKNKNANVLFENLIHLNNKGDTIA